MTTNLDVFNNYTNRNLDNLSTYRVCDENEDCLKYMFVNGQDIYNELDLFNEIPKQVEQEKISNLFNTNNIIKTNLLNDTYINQIANQYSISDEFVINTILAHLRPILFRESVINNEVINSLKTKIENTIQFEQNYMNTVKNQVDYLMSVNTMTKIRNEINNKLGRNVEVKDDYINGIMRHEISNYRSRYGEDKSKMFGIESNNVYMSKMSLFRTKDIFVIINDVIERVVSNINIENNMIENNSKLDKWNTVYGDNNNGMRRHSNIKLNEKKPKGMLFNMTY